MLYSILDDIYKVQVVELYRLTVCFWPILLKKSVRPNSLVIDWLKRLFCPPLREI